jgi:hypothetical protein
VEAILMSLSAIKNQDASGRRQQQQLMAKKEMELNVLISTVLISKRILTVNKRRLTTSAHGMLLPILALRK